MFSIKAALTLSWIMPCSFGVVLDDMVSSWSDCVLWRDCSIDAMGSDSDYALTKVIH